MTVYRFSSKSDLSVLEQKIYHQFFGSQCTNVVSVFTARCTLVQSAVLRSHVVCLSVCLSVCNVGEL